MIAMNIVYGSLLVVMLWGVWLGIKNIRRKISYLNSRNSAPRFNMRETRLRARMEKCPGEFCLLDLSQTGMAIFIDHFVDGFSLTKHERFVLRHTHGDVPARLVTGKVIYLKQLDHGYRMGIQFDVEVEAELVELFARDLALAVEQEQEPESDMLDVA